MSAETMIFDFKSPEASGRWQIVNDGVMGGVSTSRFGVRESVAVFEGDVSLENNGGFASVRSMPARHTLAGNDALVIRVRGDGQRYKFNLRTDSRFDGVTYQTAFATRAGAWEEHRLPFRDFVPTFRGRTVRDYPALDPGTITSLGLLIADKQSGPFRLEVAWVRATPTTD